MRYSRGRCSVVRSAKPCATHRSNISVTVEALLSTSMEATLAVTGPWCAPRYSSSPRLVKGSCSTVAASFDIFFTLPTTPKNWPKKEKGPSEDTHKRRNSKGEYSPQGDYRRPFNSGIFPPGILLQRTSQASARERPPRQGPYYSAKSGLSDPCRAR